LAAPELLPLFVARLSALPTDDVFRLRQAPLSLALANLVDAERSIAVTRDEVSRALHAAIGRQEQRRLRNALVEVRRSLYNGRCLSERQVEVVDQTLSLEERQCVQAFTGLLELRNQRLARIELAYETGLRQSRRMFQKAVADSRFQNGVMLSSSALYRNLERYQSADPQWFDSRNEQIERGLLRYFTRAAMKATPFATFCSVAVGQLVDPTSHVSRSDKLITIEGDPSQQKVFTRLNKSIYGVLWSHLKQRPAVRRQLTVDLNPTLHSLSGKWVFLANVRGREVFQRIGRNEAIDLIEMIVRDRAPILAELTDRLMTDPGVEAGREEASAYLDSLLEAGFLRFRTSVTEQECDWDLPLRSALSTVDDEHARLTVELLTTLREQLQQLERLPDLTTRGDIIARMHSSIRQALERLGIPTQVPRNLPVFEDATSAARLCVVRDAPLQAALDCLSSFLKLTLPISHPRREQATMRHFFDTFYDATKPVSLLRFYEDFYREHLKTHLEKERLRASRQSDKAIDGYDFFNPFGLAIVAHLGDASRQVAAVFRDAWAKDPTAEEVNVDLAAIERVTSPLGPLNAMRSVSVFCQPISVDGIVRAGRLFVSGGNYHAGFGKYFSRFLYMLPDELRVHTRLSNAALSEGLLAEIRGDELFNGNFHPQLADWEISYPTGESASSEGQLDCADLQVIRDADDPFALALQHRDTGKRILPLDLGFLAMHRRPPLFQLLAHFMPAGQYSIGLPDSLAKSGPSEPESSLVDDKASSGIGYRPRMTINGCLVVGRRRWSIPARLYPHQHATEPGHVYFVRVNNWRRQNGIPAEVYVRLRPTQGQGLNPGATVLDTGEGTRREKSSKPGNPVPAMLIRANVPRTESDVVATACDGRGNGQEFAEGDPSNLGILRSRTQPSLGLAGPGLNELLQNASLPRNDTENEIAVEVNVPEPRLTSSIKPEHHSRDWGKPQYIDFENPLLVKLFARLPAGLSGFTAYLEERYPPNSALPEAHGHRYSAEFILQYTFVGRSERQYERVDDDIGSGEECYSHPAATHG
jgi:hypothetical protein